MLGRTAKKRQFYKQKKSERGMSGPPVTAMSYKGAINREMRDDTTVIANIYTSGTIKGTSVANAASYSSVFGADPTGLSDFTDLKGLYQEFRILGLRVDYYPCLANAYVGLPNTIGPTMVGTTDNNISPLILARYHGDATALSSLANAMSHAEAKIKPINVKSSESVRMSESDEAQWFSTTSGTVPVMGIKTYAEWNTVGATDHVTWGNTRSTFLVQFRGRVVSATQMKNKVVYTISAKDAKDKDDAKSSSSTFSLASTGGKVLDDEYVRIPMSVWQASQKSQKDEKEGKIKEK